MDRVGQPIRSAYHWIPATKPRYLVTDNIQEHCADEAIEKYVSTLKDKYNIVTIFQVLPSPYTNVLDLGVWYAPQTRVETRDFGK